MTPGSAKVVLSDLANEYVIADAVRFVRNPTGNSEVLVDNTEASTTGTWVSTNGTGGGIYRGTNFLYHDNGAATITWTPSLPAAGRWRVYARWSSWAGRPPAIDYVVNHAGGSTPVTVDQRYNGGQWNSLGEFDLAPGQNHRVTLSAVAGTRSIADSVRFVPVVGARIVQADAVKIVPNTAEDALYVHTDQLGTPRKLTDPSGAVVWDASFTPYGIEDSIAGTQTLDARFPGQSYDAESDLNYNTFRDYDPTLGRHLGLSGGAEQGLGTVGKTDNVEPVLGSQPVDGVQHRDLYLLHGWSVHGAGRVDNKNQISWRYGRFRRGIPAGR